jgi:predicted alpha/beta-fold hydrolase
MSETPEPFVARPFRPARWLANPHAQTVAGRYLRRRTGVHYRRERLETPDGDFLDLDFASVRGVEVPAGAPLVLVVHGLEGSSRSSYVLETCRALALEGMGAVAINFRTCGGEMNRTARFYHAGETSDLAFVLDLLAARFLGVPLGAVGFSLGANVLLKYLGERGDAARRCLRAAAAVSVPFDLHAGEVTLQGSRMGRLYVRALLRTLQKKVRAKAHLVGDRLDAARALAATSFREFDDAGTAPLHGFRDVDHYYGTSSSGPFLPHVRLPTLLVHSLDDPFQPATAIPHGAVSANPWLNGVFPAQGGHVGFIAGPPWAPEFWAEREAARFLAGHLLEPPSRPGRHSADQARPEAEVSRSGAAER